MSEFDQNSKIIIQEFSSSIDDLQKFVLTSKKRALSDIQKKNLVKNKIREVTLNYNKLLGNIDPEARTKVLFESISQVTDIINSMDFADKFELIWIKLNTLINSFASQVTSLNSVGDIWRMQGSALLLAQILMGLPKIDHLPDRLEHSSIEDPEYLDLWTTTFNSIQFSARTYINVISAIKTFNFSDFVNWVNESYFYLSLLNHYFNIFDFSNIALVLKTEPKRFFTVVTIMCYNFELLVNHSLLLTKFLGTKWPSDITTADLFDDRTLGGYLNLLKYVQEINKIAINKENEIYKSGLWTMNDNPMEAEPTQALLDLNSSYDCIASYITSLKIIEPELQKLLNSNNETIIESLSETIRLNDQSLTNLEKEVGSHDNLINSPIVFRYIDLVDRQFEIICLLIICTGDISYLENLLKKIDWLLSNEKFIQFENLVVKKFLSELFIATKLQKLDMVENLYNELPAILESIEKSYRDFSSFVVLEYIIGFLLDKRAIPTKDEILVKINKNGLIAGGDFHLYDEFQEYVEYLTDVLHGENSFLSEKLLQRKSFMNICDSITWLIPDFNLTFKNKLPIPLYYLPFNRYCDGIQNFTPI